MMLGRKKRTPHLVRGLGAALALLLPDEALAAPFPLAAMLARRRLERVAVEEAAGEAGPGEAEREEELPAMLRRVRTTMVWLCCVGCV